MSKVHVFPVDDLVEHDTTGDDCVCGPATTFVDGGWVITHHALDGREHSEPDHDRLNCPICPHPPRSADGPIHINVTIDGDRIGEFLKRLDDAE